MHIKIRMDHAILIPTHNTLPRPKHLVILWEVPGTFYKIPWFIVPLQYRDRGILGQYSTIYDGTRYHEPGNTMVFCTASKYHDICFTMVYPGIFHTGPNPHPKTPGFAPGHNNVFMS